MNIEISHDAHANHAAQAAAETVAAAKAAKHARQKRAAEAAGGRAIGHKTHPRPALSHGEASARGGKVFGPGRLVPLDRNAEVRVMMVSRALMPLFDRVLENIRTFDLAA
jgi:sRNA-binding protein